MQDIVGGTSAAALGFITNGIKGAKTATELYSLYSKYSNSKSDDMASKPTKKRSSSGTAKTKRRTEWKVKRVRRNSNYLRKRNDGVSNTASKMGSKKIRLGKRKLPLKVSSSLRRKIQKVVNADKAKGHYMHISYYSNTPGVAGPPADQQSFEYMGLITNNGTDTNRILFSPLGVLASVGRLMNPVQVPASFMNDINLATILAQDTIGTKFIPLRTAKINVVSQSCVYRIRNNTGRTVTMKIYCCEPKTIDYSNTVGLNPVTVWGTGLNTQDNSLKSTGENPLEVKVETLYSNPRMVQQFRNHYKFTETIVQIEPGKEYNYKVKGPSMMYDFAKYWLDNKFYDKQRFTKQVFFTAYNDLTRTSLGTVGRYTDNTVGDPFSILIEQTYSIKFTVPDQVGFEYIAPATGTPPVVTPAVTDTQNQVRNQVRTCFGIDNFQGAQAGIVQYASDQNPIQPADANMV